MEAVIFTQWHISATEKAYLLSRVEMLHDSMLLIMPTSLSHAEKLTRVESKYFWLIINLLALLRIGLAAPEKEPLTSTFLTTKDSIFKLLFTLPWELTDEYGSSPNPEVKETRLLYNLINPHAMSLSRDGALAAKYAITLLLKHPGLHKEVVDGAKYLEGIATAVLKLLKGRNTQLMKALNEGGWIDRMDGWTFGSGGEAGKADRLDELVKDALGPVVLEEWGMRVVESWRENWGIWATVKWE